MTTQTLDTAGFIATSTNPEPPTGELDHATSVFAGVWPRLFAIAYRILGDASEAEDVVLDAWLRWQRTDRSVVSSPGAFLATTTARLALNVTQSARRRHAAHTDGAIPERSTPDDGPEIEVENTDAVELAVLLLMERLNPAELAAYLLRKAFDYPYPMISEILRVGSAHARKLVSRAAARITAGRPRPVKPAAHRRLVRAFLAASRTGDLTDLEDLLAADVTDHRTRRHAVRP